MAAWPRLPSLFTSSLAAPEGFQRFYFWLFYHVGNLSIIFRISTSCPPRERRARLSSGGGRSFEPCRGFPEDGSAVWEPMNKSSWSFLLESVEGGEHIGRYTFFGVDPFQIISSRGRRISVQRGKEQREESGSIFDYLREAAKPFHPIRIPGLPPFSAGAVGYLAYEAVRILEKLPPRVEPDVDVEDA